MRLVTWELDVWSPAPEEVEVGRNHRRSAAAVAQKRQNWRRFKSSRLDSLHEDDQGEKAVLVVVSDRRGEVCSAGAMVRKVVAVLLRELTEKRRK
jgi:hypothetical protein